MRLSLLVMCLALSANILLGQTRSTFAEDTSVVLVEGAFGNTISIVNSVGEETLVWLKRDMTYESKLPTGQKHKGVWSVEGETICFQIMEPKNESGSAPICGPLIANRGPGDQWESMVSDGSIVTISIKEGIVGK